MSTLSSTKALLTCALLAATATAQNTRPLAIRNARILPLTTGENAGTIENGTILIKDGKISEIGADVKIPPGTEIVDANGGTVMPGLVNAWSDAGLSASAASRGAPQPTRRFRRRFGRGGGSRSKPVNQAAKKVAESLYARQDVFGELLQQGVTTLAIAPTGTGVMGLAARVDPSKPTIEGFILDDDAFVALGVEAMTKVKETLKSALGSGKKRLEERNAPPPEAEKDDKKTPTSKPSETGDGKGEGGDAPKKDKPKPDEPKPKPDPKPGDDPKPTPTPDPTPKPKDDPKPSPDKGGAEDKKPKDADDAKKPPTKKVDPNAEVLADLLEKKRRAFVEVDSAQTMVHYMDALGDHRFDQTIVADTFNAYSGGIDVAVEHLQKIGAAVLIPPSLATAANSDMLYDPGRRLRENGIEVGYLIGDSKSDLRDLFFDLIELVRSGAQPNDVLRGVTAIPAKMLGVSRDVGTLEKGKRADLLLFDGDPLDPTSRLVDVYYRGKRVSEDSE